MTGPVSAALEAELREAVRKRGTVVWRDPEAAYTRFAADLAARHAAGEIAFPVVGFRGSFLEMLFELEPYGGGLDRQPLLIHLPGFDEKAIRKTPLLELARISGPELEKSLESLIRKAANGRFPPAEVERFLATRPSLEQADAWVTSAITKTTLGLAATLEQIGETLVFEALGQPKSTLAQQVTAPAEVEILTQYLHNRTGIDEEWLVLVDARSVDRTFETVRRALEAWLLWVEYVHDLQRPPYRQELQRLRALPPLLVQTCQSWVIQLRAKRGDVYEPLAIEVAGLFDDELAQMTAEDLGRIDTFKEEEAKVLEGAVAALQHRDWAKASAWCKDRNAESSFWLRKDRLRPLAWSFVREAAAFGEILSRHPAPLAGARSLDEAVSLYAESAYRVDRLHRRFEQRRLALLDSSLPHYGPLREVATALRRAHREWADALSQTFAALCVERGFLPSPSLQQRTLFEQVVHPLVQGDEKVALFLVDAFRYEMATELAEELRDAGGLFDLRPRLAELPTVTSLGMNALAPVSQAGRLAVAGSFEGLRWGEALVRTPEDRARAMGQRSTGKPALLLKLAQVCDEEAGKLKRSVKPHSLVVVHSREIDDAGEANVGLPTFESTLRQLKTAWHHLQLAGIRSFVFTADHGFLLVDETTHLRPFGTRRTPQHRYVLDEVLRAETGLVSVATSSLGYDEVAGFLHFPDDTSLFNIGNVGVTFAHGGNSPQERVIPVLTLTQTQPQEKDLSEYKVEARALDDVLGLHRLQLRVVHLPGSLNFLVGEPVDISFRIPKRAEIRVTLKEAAPPAKLRAGRIEVPIGETWSEVFFGLEGPQDERVRIEVHHAEGRQKVRPATPDVWYSVSGTTQPAASSPRPLPPAPAWAEAIPDEGTRRVFLHIEKHGAITEAEATHLLGSPRDFRRFSLEFDQHLAKLPFRVRIEPGEGGKRYVREGER